MDPGMALFADLPDELVADILSRLPTRSVCRCRAVCRSWRALTSDPRFLRANAARDRATAVHMSHHQHLSPSSRDDELTIRLAFVYDTHNMPCRFFHLESCKDGSCKLLGSWDGIICLGVRRDSPACHAVTVVVNPVSMTCAVVGNPMPEAEDGEFIAGYAHPITFAFHIIYCCYKQGKPVFQVIKVGDPQWREIEAVRLASVADTLAEIDYGKQAISSVALHGKLHWQLRTNSAQWVILVFDMVTEEFRSAMHK